jgi:hypothetical protein
LRSALSRPACKADIRSCVTPTKSAMIYPPAPYARINIGMV